MKQQTITIDDGETVRVYVGAITKEATTNRTVDYRSLSTGITTRRNIGSTLELSLDFDEYTAKGGQND